MAVELAYQDSGSGPPLVILHGLFGSGRNWTRLARQLAESWRVYALDLRNHGESPWDGEMDYLAMADDVLAFLDRRGLDRATLIGHSMGGKAAMAVALVQPARVEALVVVDIAPSVYALALQGYVDAMQALDLSSLSRRGEADAALRSAVADPAIRGFLLQNLVARNGRYSWRPNLTVLAAAMPVLSAFPDELFTRTYRGRTLFLGGGLSDYIRPEHRPTIQALFPRARIEMVPGVGHWVHAEAPEVFLAHLQAFLGDKADRQAVQ